MARSRTAFRYSLTASLLLALCFARDSWTDEGDNRGGPPVPPGSNNGAVLQSFPDGSLIIPLDGCYQRTDTMDDVSVEEIFGAEPDDLVCNSTGDEGVVEAYGLVTRLVEAGVPVHWSVKNFKTNMHEADFSITNSSDAPVEHLDPSTLTTSDIYGALTTIRYAGGPLVVSADDTDGDGASDADEALTALGSFGGSFGSVDLHVATIDFDAPIYRAVDQLPKMAVVDIDSATAGNFTSNATGQVIDSPDGYMIVGGFSAIGSWWETVTVDEVISGKLVDDSYTLLWVPEFGTQNSGADDYIRDFVRQIGEFADAGGHVVVIGEAVRSIEGFGNTPGGSYKETQPPTQNFHLEGGLLQNGEGSGTWGSCNGDEQTLTDDASDPNCQWGGQCWFGPGGGLHSWKDQTAPDVSDPSEEVEFATGVDGCAITYHTSDADKRGWMLASYRHKGGDPDKGRLIYLGSTNWRTNKPVGFRIMFNSILAAPNALNVVRFEVSRSSPTLSAAAGETTIYQGSLDAVAPPEAKTTFTGSASASAFVFPHFSGHFRAINAALFSGDRQLEEFSDGDGTDDCPDSAADTGNECVFDADLLIPSLSSGECVSDPPSPGEPVTGADTSCRVVFTNLATGQDPQAVSLDENSLGGPLDALLDPADAFDDDELVTLVERIQAGAPDGGGGYEPRLGGIDRSTPAVIGESTLVGADALPSDSARRRPTMAYFGALDGMLHAVCLDDLGACTAGKELWAFLPRTQLSLLAANDQRIDGTPKVADVFGDFGTFDVDGSFSSATPDGRNEFRTVLVFQTASNVPDNEEAVYGVDISNPFEPRVLWETLVFQPDGADGDSDPDVTGGAGLTVALGTAQTSNGEQFLAFVQTNKNGGNGFVVRALDLVDGSLAWSNPFDYDYDDSVRGGSLPDDTGVPTGVSLVDTTGLALVDQVLVPSLYGELWVLDAGTGVSRFDDGSGVAIPLFRFEEDFHPIGATPSVFSDGVSFFALIGSGGYADYINSVKTWSPSTENQFAVSINLGSDPGNEPFDEDSLGANGVIRDLGAGNRVFAQATIAGEELLIITDSEDINASSYGRGASTGTVHRFGNLTDTAAGSTTIVTGGAASVEAVAGTGTGYVAGSKSLSKVDGLDFSSGTGVELGAEPKSVRRLWLTLQ